VTAAEAGVPGKAATVSASMTTAAVLGKQGYSQEERERRDGSQTTHNYIICLQRKDSAKT
jgi:hypothetical protein